MRKRIINVDWRSVNGACQRKRILHLNVNGDGIFVCPIDDCLHTCFKSQRGLRKHIDSIYTHGIIILMKNQKLIGMK